MSYQYNSFMSDRENSLNALTTAGKSSHKNGNCLASFVLYLVLPVIIIGALIVTLAPIVLPIMSSLIK